jgi:hypothetical protein
MMRWVDDDDDDDDDGDGMGWDGFLFSTVFL